MGRSGGLLRRTGEQLIETVLLEFFSYFRMKQKENTPVGELLSDPAGC